jgi:type II secretory pathway component HofQ
MRTIIGTCLVAALLVAIPRAQAQESPGSKAPEVEKTPGKRLRVQFQETRRRGEAIAATRTCFLTLHADAGAAWVFVGTQAALTSSDRGASTTMFKNAGVEAQATVETLPDGRYRLKARFEDSSPLAAGEGAVAGTNPILQTLRGESRLTLREGETVPFASAVDPASGELVQVDVAISAPVAPRAAPAAGVGERLRARVLLTRRQGEKTIARRPYSVVVDPGSDEAANVFGGSMLPVQVTAQGQPTVMLKDVGAGLRLTARRIPDGRYRLALSFSDGTLAPAAESPAIKAFQTESQVFAHDGETVTVASAVDPQTGELVEAEVTVESLR